MNGLNLKELTKRNKVVKSCTFELVPQGATSKTIEQSKFLNTDADWKQLISEIAPYIDAFIRNIVSCALSRVELDCSKDEMDEVKLASEINLAINSALNEKYGIYVKQIKSAKFINSVLPDFVDTLDLDENESIAVHNVLEELRGKTELVNEFLTSRVTALNTSVARRVCENFERYQENVKVFEKLQASSLWDTIVALYPNAGDFANVDSYNECITQEQIDTYNDMINGISDENGIIVKGIRGLINEYRMLEKNEKLPSPKELYKQILIPGKKAFSIICIDNDDELYDVISEASEHAVAAGKRFCDLIDNASAYDIVVQYKNLHTISHIVTGEHRTIPDAVKDVMYAAINQQIEAATTAKKRLALQKKVDDIEKALKKCDWTMDELEKISNLGIFSAYKTSAKNAYLLASGTVGTIPALTKDIRNNDAQREELKSIFNVWTEFRDLVRLVKRQTLDKGYHAFYDALDEIIFELSYMAKAETLTIAYVTRKPKDVSKKALASMGYQARMGAAWLQPDKKLSICDMTILKRDGKYYLYMLAPGVKPVNITTDKSDEYVFVQKKGQDASKALPKVTFYTASKFFEENPDAEEFVITNNVTEPVTISRELFDMKENGLFKTDAVKKGLITQEEYEKNLFEILSFYRHFMDVYTEYSKFDVQTKSDLHDYKDSGEFFTDVNAANVSSEWLPADTKKMDEMVDKGEALMFLITNRNMYSQFGKKTAYAELFLTAMSDSNMGVFLNSSPKMYFRAKSITKPIVHKKGSILVHKHDTNGNKIPKAIYDEIYKYYNNKLFATDLSQEARDYIDRGLVGKKKADTDIVKDNRYTEDKWMIQFSYTKNRTVIPASTKLNDIIRQNAANMNVLSIIRSETDLAYYMVTAPDGTVLEKQSLNIIDGRDYWSELSTISAKRKDEKSQSWNYSRQVKDQRDPYIVRAISVIARKVIEYNAIVVIERIRPEIKNRFDAMDNTVFKKFEGMLISRLADLYFSDVPAGEPGSVMNPYQLCENSGNDYQDGIVFFVSNAYTGNVDNQTGFVNIFDLGNVGTVSAKRLFLSKFDSIVYDPAQNRFVFDFDYDNFVTKTCMKKTKWSILAGGEALIFNREFKYNTYYPETASMITKIMAEKNVSLSDNLAKLAATGELPGDVTTALFDAFRRAISGVISKHEDMPKRYISPVTGEAVIYNDNAAENLTRRFRFNMAELEKDKTAREEWIDNIA